MIKSDRTFKKHLTLRLNYNWKWLLYYWNLTITLYNFKLPNVWYFNYKIIHKSKINKPKISLNIIKKDLLVAYDEKNVSKKNLDLINLNIFFTFMSLSMSPYTKYSRPHTFFTLLFMDHNRQGSFTLNLKRSYMRWSGTYSLLFNLFYYNHDVVIFGHKIFRIDLLAINTVTCKKVNTMFKYSTIFNRFRESLYGANIIDLMYDVKSFEIETAFITDMTSLEKLATNLQVCDVYTIGIVSFADNPWSVSYPVPVHSNGLFTQYYFIRQLYHIQQNSSYTRFNQLTKLWTNF